MRILSTHRFQSLLLVALLALGSGARAQIVVTRDAVDALLTSSRTTAQFRSDTTATARASLQTLVARTGADQTWDFTPVAFFPGLTLQHTLVTAPQPGSSDPHFADATHIVRTDAPEGDFPTGYGYYRLDADRLVSLGSSGSGPVLRYEPGVVQPLPYTFGTAWASETRVVFDPPAFPGQQTIREESSVVGWGRLVTPGGAAPALMVETRLIQRTSFEVPGAPPAVTVDTTRSVTFLTGGATGALVLLDRLGRAQAATYTVAAGGTASTSPPVRPGLRLSVDGPHPAARGSALDVRFALDRPGRASLAVFDVLGRRVATLAEGERPAGAGVARWATAGLPAGLYVVRLQAGGEAAVRRVVVR